MRGMVHPDEVLDFWFGPLDARGKPRPEWFRKDGRFDEEIRGRFGATHAAAAARELETWRASAESMLALVVVLDQFSRNIHRHDARAFAQDGYARECSEEAIERGLDLGMLPVERQFLYLPFEHSERLEDQERALELFRTLEAFEETRGLLAWAERHHAVIARFGRFPHRNVILGRASTPEEEAFLAQPGSGF